MTGRMPPPSAGSLAGWTGHDLVCEAPLHWSAGHEHLLLAVARLGPGARLTIIGEGPDEDRVRFTVADLGLDGQVRLVAPRPGCLAEVLGQGAVAVLAAVDDRPWPSIPAALDAGATVVASDLPWLRAQRRPGGRLRLVSPRSPEALADALAEGGATCAS